MSIFRNLIPRCRSIVAAALLSGAPTSACRADSPFLIDTWTPYEGLPQSHVLSIAQTPDGYLWISTQLGWLARFDGITFTAFNSENTPALVSPEILKLMVDDRGVLWIADIDGRLVSYQEGGFRNRVADKPGFEKRIVDWLGRDGDAETFVTGSGGILRLGREAVYEQDKRLPPSGEGVLRQFARDGGGQIWCRTGLGVTGLWNDGQFSQKPLSNNPPAPLARQLLRLPDGDLLAATDQGVWNIRDDAATQAFPSIFEQIPDSADVLQVARNPDGSTWILTREELFLVGENEILRRVPTPGIASPPMLRPLEMVADSSGSAWIMKGGTGVWQVNPSGETAFLSTASGLPSNLVEAWFEDREHNIWLGTAAGLVRLKPRWFQIVETRSAGPGNSIVSVAEAEDGTVWMGRSNGLSHWKDGAAEDVPLPPVRPNFQISDVIVCPGNSPDEVWLGSVGSGAMLLRDGRIEHPFTPFAAGYAIRVIRRDAEGGIWFGGEFGLFRWDGKTLRKFGPEDGLTAGHIHDLAFDAAGEMWVAKGEDLLAVYQDGRFRTVPLPGISPALRINSLVCSSAGDVWIGTVGGGLIQLDGDRVRRYTVQDGLPSNSVTQLMEDDNGTLWGGTPRGVFRVSLAALENRARRPDAPVLFQTYSHSDGLPTAECPGGLQPACWKARDGRLWFSTAAAAVFVNPREVRKNEFPPAAIIEGMRLNDAPWPLSPTTGVPVTNPLPPGRHRYEFDFTGLSFTAPEKVRFQWRMSGVDSGWINGGAQRNAAYNGLDPGKYLFEVRARNNDGVWSPEPAAVRFQVAPYFYQRRPVQTAALLGVLAGVALLISLAMRRRHQRELRQLDYERGLEQQRFRHKQAMEAERARIAAELHDDLGANLTQIQWLGEAAHRAHEPASGEGELLLRISRKSREMVRLIDQIVWAVNPKNDTLEQLVTYVCNFAEQYFRDSETRCRIDVGDHIAAYPLKADVRHHLFLIAKEALHNVAKHAATDRVWIRVSCDDTTFKLVIEDRGCGFDPASMTDDGADGLANMRRRATQSGASLDIRSAPGQGTVIALVLNLEPTAP